MPPAIPFLVKALVATLISVAFKALTGALTGKLNKKKPRRIESPARENKATITETVASLPKIYGRSRVGCSRVFVSQKLAYAGEKTTSQQGQVTITETRGEYLYTINAFCQGQIEDIEQVYLNGVPVTDSKFSDGYRVSISLTWIYSEPSPVTIVTYEPRKVVVYASRNGNPYIPGLGYATYTNPIRYYLYRKPASGGNRILLTTFTGGRQSINVPNVDYGNWVFELEYRKDTGEVILVGDATVTITQDDADFVQTVNDNLTVSQSSFLSSAYVQFDEKRGLLNQTPSSVWLSQGVPSYSSDITGNNIALLYSRLLVRTKGDDIDNSPINGLTDHTADIKGSLVYDPRKDSTNGGSGSHRYNDPNTWEWSDNPILCLRDYLTDTVCGLGFAQTEINDAFIISEADYADELITSSTGVSIKRYVCNGRVDTGKARVDNVIDLLESMNADLYRDVDKWVIRIMKPEASTWTFDANNMIGNLEINQLELRSKVNIFKAKFLNKETAYETDIVEIRNDDFIAADKNKEYPSEAEYTFCNDYDHAYYLGVQALKQARMGLTFSFSTFWDAFENVPGDVVTLNRPDLGITNKLIRIDSMEPDNSTGLIKITAIEYDEDVYTVDNIDPRGDDLAVSLPSPFDVQAPENIQIAQTFKLDNLGNYLEIVRLSWNPSTSPNVQQYQVDFKPIGFGDWALVGTTQANQIETQIFAIGTYEVRVKAINNIGASSAYTSQNIEVFAFTDIPDDVQNFRLQNSNNEVSLSWDNNPRISNAGFYRIRHTQKTANPDWTDPPTFELFVPGYQNSVTLSQIDGTYMIKAINTAGLESSNFASYTLDLPDDVDWQLKITNQQDNTFPGTKVLTAVADNKLILTGLTNWDDLTGNWDDISGNWDDTSGKSLVGTYDFDSTSDLGAVYKVKLKRAVQANLYQAGRNWDDITDNWDDVQGLWDGDSPINLGINVAFRTTRDNPAGSPTWSDWQLLTVNEVTARAFQFKCELFLASQEEGIEIEQLRSLIYLKQRLEQGVNTSSASGVKTINFEYAFYETPTSVAVTILNPSTGDYATVSNITATSFNVRVQNTAGTDVVRNIQYVVQGIGQKLA